MSTEYRIAEQYRQFTIQVRHDGKEWRDLSAMPRVPRFFDSLADARSWVATIKRGVVYHDADAEYAKTLLGAVDFLKNNPRYTP
jgi:hypothetical protein